MKRKTSNHPGRAIISETLNRKPDSSVFVGEVITPDGDMLEVRFWAKGHTTTGAQFFTGTAKWATED